MKTYRLLLLQPTRRSIRIPEQLQANAICPMVSLVPDANVRVAIVRSRAFRLLFTLDWIDGGRVTVPQILISIQDLIIFNRLFLAVNHRSRLGHLLDVRIHSFL